MLTLDLISSASIGQVFRARENTCFSDITDVVQSGPPASCVDGPTPIMGSPAVAIPGAAARELPRILFSHAFVSVIGRPHLPLSICHIDRV